jgi:hypothetical protein
MNTEIAKNHLPGIFRTAFDSDNDNSLDNLLKKSSSKLSDIVGDDVGDIGSTKAGTKAGTIASTQVSTIANTVDEAISVRAVAVLKKCKTPIDRSALMEHLKISNQRKNYEDHAKPLVDLGWVAMTIPDRPTSPKQKYYTTLRGYALLAILKK